MSDERVTDEVKPMEEPGALNPNGGLGDAAIMVAA